MLELARQGVVPGGTGRSHAFVGPYLAWADLSEPEQFVLADAQTSGGLLLSVPGDHAGALLAALRAGPSPSAAIIGRVVAEPGLRVRRTGS